MQAGQVYEIFVDCTRNDLVTNADVLDEIVSQLNEKLGITTRWEQYSRNNVNCVRIYLPSPDLKMHDRTQFIVLDLPIPSPNNAKRDFTDADDVLALSCFYNSDTFVNAVELTNRNYFIGTTSYTAPYGLLFKTGQLTLRIDTTMWTEQNNFYQIYAIFTNNYSGAESLPANVKFTHTKFVIKVKKTNPDVEYDVLLSESANTIFWAATPSDYAQIIPTEQPSETSITLHKLFSGAYENDYWYWLRAGDNSTVKEYVSWNRLPFIESDHRKLKSLNDEYDVFLAMGSSTSNPSLVLKKS